MNTIYEYNMHLSIQEYALHCNMHCNARICIASIVVSYCYLSLINIIKTEFNSMSLYDE